MKDTSVNLLKFSRIFLYQFIVTLSIAKVISPMIIYAFIMVPLKSDKSLFFF